MTESQNSMTGILGQMLWNQYLLGTDERKKETKKERKKLCEI